MKINTINNKIDNQKAVEAKAVMDLKKRLRSRNDMESLKKFTANPFKRFK